MVSQRLSELAPFLEQEIDPTGEVSRAVALLLEASPFPSEPLSGDAAGPPWSQPGRETGGPGHRIPRAVVADALGNRVLDLLWEPIEETDVPRMADRLARLRIVFRDVPSGRPACTLLTRLSPGGDLAADFDYRLSRESRAELRQNLRDRCSQGLPPPPSRPSDPVVVPDPRPDPKPDPIKPTPTPQTPATRLLETIGTWEFKSDERRIKAFEKFEIHGWLEAALQIGFEGTEAERVVVKARWLNGEFKPEMEGKLNDLLGVDFEGEWDKKPEFRLKRDIRITERFTLTPKAKLNPLEPFELEGSASTPGFPLKLGSLAFTVKGELKGIAVVRLAWRRLIKERVKDWLKRQFKDLADRILRFFGGKLIKDRLRLILIAAAGLMLVKLLFDDDEQPATEDPVRTPPDPDDVLGFDAVLEVAQGQDAARARLLEEARGYRNAFAIGFGDTLSKLAEPNWRDLLARNYTVIYPKGFLDLPKAPPGDARAWRIWAVDAHRQRQDTVDLRNDDYVRRFRENEVALMWAVLASVTSGQTGTSVKTAIATAKQQASAAGMAAAVRHVRSMIKRETYEFMDEQGRRQTRSGITTWDDMAAAARAAVPDELTRQRRLARLVTDVLPRIR